MRTQHWHRISAGFSDETSRKQISEALKIFLTNFNLRYALYSVRLASESPEFLRIQVFPILVRDLRSYSSIRQIQILRFMTKVHLMSGQKRKTTDSTPYDETYRISTIFIFIRHFISDGIHNKDGVVMNEEESA